MLSEGMTVKKGYISENEDVILEFVSLPQRDYGVVRTNEDMPRLFYRR